MTIKSLLHLSEQSIKNMIDYNIYDKKDKYNLNNIDSKNALFNLVYGMRANGKSFQAKIKKMIINFLNTGEKFGLVRRFREETTKDKIEAWFSDCHIQDLSQGKYIRVAMSRSKLYFVEINQKNGKEILSAHVGYVFNLSQEQYYAGGSYLDITNLIFDEFISRSSYLYQEPTKFINLWSTIDRNRKQTRVWLFGNTITQVCPYFQELNLMHIVKNQKIGTIEETTIKAGQDSVSFALEYTQMVQGGVAFGQHADMLNTGTWQADIQPIFRDNIKNYRVMFTVIFYFQDFTFLARYMCKSKNKIWYIVPKTTPIKEKTFVISDIINYSMYWRVEPYQFEQPKIRIIMDTFRESNIFFSDYLTGTNFKKAINFTIKP